MSFTALYFLFLSFCPWGKPYSELPFWREWGIGRNSLPPMILALEREKPVSLSLKLAFQEGGNLSQSYILFEERQAKRRDCHLQWILSHFSSCLIFSLILRRLLSPFPGLTQKYLVFPVPITVGFLHMDCLCHQMTKAQLRFW